MESTGKYQISLYNILDAICSINLVHPKYMKARKQTNKKQSGLLLSSSTTLYPAVLSLRQTPAISGILENPAEELTDVSAFQTRGIKATNEQILTAVDGQMEASINEAIFILDRQGYLVSAPPTV